jgi:transposase
LDETGFLMSPIIRRTWAVRGQTPFLYTRTRSYEKISGIGALAVSPRKQRLSFYLSLHKSKNIRTAILLRFLKHLRKHLSGPVVLLWDRGQVHRAKKVSAYLSSLRDWEVAWLPPYAPEMNPMEHGWSYLKYGCLANFAPAKLDELHKGVMREYRKTAHNSHLIRSFFRGSELPFFD